MKEKILVPASRAQVQLKISNSRFISTVSPAFSVEEARAFLDEMKNTYSDATHNVPVYIIGHGASITTHCSDDGEPSGTAGRPALAVLQGSGLGDIAVVITRYFGGTKLGTGGLVRAYSESMREVLAAVPKAEKVLCHRCSMEMPYPLYEPVKRLLLTSRTVVLEERFTEKVLLHVQIAADSFQSLQAELGELSRGTLQLEIERENFFALSPVSHDSDHTHSD
ncbi:MAG: YigZ family protein [Anaerolineales bacterium]|nr:YigZ family protein [Anaerolineales bacterium]